MNNENLSELYWPGNAAKTRVIRDIARRSGENPNVIIFDFGCGNAGGWRSVLNLCPNFYLIAYDINPQARNVARINLKGLRGEVIDDVEQICFQADYIVSFSVFEHVYDREYYLTIAKRVLSPKGVFYLNYDDGHFRIQIDLSNLSTLVSLKVWIHNLLAPYLAKVGLKTKFQERVYKKDLERLIQTVGFEVCEEFYGNLGCLKGLYKYIAPNKVKDFMDMWVSFEESLNEQFREKLQENYAGDEVNLWRFMASRTLVLRHKDTRYERT
jgi:SAM-dependent methyltransferase